MAFCGNRRKFYIEDETGGVQVYVPGSKGGVNVAIGDRVRVTGATEIYRDSLEVVLADFSTDIEIAQAPAKSCQSLFLPPPPMMR